MLAMAAAVVQCAVGRRGLERNSNWVESYVLRVGRTNFRQSKATSPSRVRSHNAVIVGYKGKLDLR